MRHSPTYKKAIIIFGPPGSGKSTQARLIADAQHLFLFDTGRFLDSMVHDRRRADNAIIARERALYDAGKLMTPSFVLGAVTAQAERIARIGSGLVFSGSPRTAYEAFGDAHRAGLVDVLMRLYGRKNVHFFELDVPASDAKKRNRSRQICSICGSPILGLVHRQLKQCPFCGGKLARRVDDNPKVMAMRMKQYHERTQPIFVTLRAKKITICRIDGSALPYRVFQSIASHFS
ncbi:MAG: nucleoside monophosphate kinase [Candidatus Paceibacterota bacterium]|jgi:adenylate kinase